MNDKASAELMNKVVSLCKRRGFVYPSSEIYGGLANSWDYGPLGVELKNNLKTSWWNFFVKNRDDMYGLDAALIMNKKIWEASGHLKKFTDPLSECLKCRSRFRPDKLADFGKCPNCGGRLSEPRPFNLMLKTFLGAVEDEAGVAYFRPETAQAIFVNFKNVIDSFHPKFPFGVAQIGKAFRNEITPGNFIFKTREFEQMEIEYFVREKDWEEAFEFWRKETLGWTKEVGVNASKIHEREVPAEELAHYSKRTVDFEYDFPFGRDELYGLAYRTDFDLKTHGEHSKQNLKYKDLETGEEFIPHVIEPSFGVDRMVLAVLLSAYSEEKNSAPANASSDKRVILKLKPALAPYKVAVFPLLANKPQLVEKAREVYKILKTSDAGGQKVGVLTVAWDERGNIGKRYYSQDEIGTPFCVTVDFQTLEDDTITVRDRDTAKQERVEIAELAAYLENSLKER